MEKRFRMLRVPQTIVFDMVASPIDRSVSGVFEFPIEFPDDSQVVECRYDDRYREFVLIIWSSEWAVIDNPEYIPTGDLCCDKTVYPFRIWIQPTTGADRLGLRVRG